jgi:N-acetylglucosamine-6-phosphate deacetylase
MSLLIRDARILSPGVDLPCASLWIQGDRIARIGAAGDLPKAAEEIDAAGLLIVPGFIDIHTHGVAGVSAMDGTGEAIRAMAAAKLREGVTQFLPTTWTESPSALDRAMRGISAYREHPDLARVPGAHVEGPYLNPKCVGAQNPAFVRLPDLAEIDRLRAIAPIRLVSVAVEMEGAIDFVRQLRSWGIVSSLAHTAATYEQFLSAKQAGLKHLTHFSNQMTPLHHRAIGIVGAGLLDDDVMVEVIADGIHLCPDMLRLVGKLIPAERLMLITDSISAAGQPDGDYIEAGQRVLVRDGVCRLESGNLAGSTLRFHRALAIFHEITGIPLVSLIATTSWNQARSLGLEGFGKVTPGFFADLALLHPETLEPVATIVAGKPVWRGNPL